MFQKSVILLVLLVVVSVQGQEEVVRPGPPDVCPSRTFNVQFHKAVPSVEMGTLRNCSSYQDKLSCCTQALTDAISMLSIFEGLYNWSYNVCGNLSESCAQYTRVCAIIIMIAVIIILLHCKTNMHDYNVYHTKSGMNHNYYTCLSMYCISWYVSL